MLYYSYFQIKVFRLLKGIFKVWLCTRVNIMNRQLHYFRFLLPHVSLQCDEKILNDFFFAFFPIILETKKSVEGIC